MAIVLRPEDIQVHKEKLDSEPFLTGNIDQIIYKGSTVDLIVKLQSGKKIAVTEFFNVDAEDLEHNIGDPVYLGWIPGWETLLKNEV